jgi:hypothetical protein
VAHHGRGSGNVTTIDPPSGIGDPIDFCIRTIVKEARKEERLVKQILHTGLSAYTKNPFNLAINSPSGEGKSYVIQKVIDNFPKQDVIVFSAMSDKALFHRQGIQVIKNEIGEFESLEDKIAKIDFEIQDKECDVASNKNTNLKQAFQAAVKGLEEKKNQLFKNAKKLIDLSHKILVFLDTPRPELFNALMPLLSHDKYEVEYEYVDTHNGIKTKTNILRGWPAVIFAQAIDYSHYARYPEIQRRFIITNPKMTIDKYEDAIQLIGLKFGIPDFAYQQTVVNDSEKEMVREIILRTREKIQDVCGALAPGKNNVVIPFHETLTSLLPKDKAFDMTTANRLFGFLSLLPIIKIEERPRLVLRKEGDPFMQIIPFALFEDLKEAMNLMEYTNGVRPYVLEWYYDIFLEVFRNKIEPASRTNSRGELLTEKRIAITTQDLADFTYEKQKKRLSTKQILETFVTPLINQGYVDKTDSDLDKRAKIYHPVITTQNRKIFESAPANNLSETNIINVTDSLLFPDQKYIISKIQHICKYSSDKSYVVEKILTHRNEEIAIEELAHKYYDDAGQYFRLNTHNNVRENMKDDDSIINNNNRIHSADKNRIVESKQENSDYIENMNTENNNLFQDGFADEYLQNSEITSEFQANGTDNMQSTTFDEQKCEKLFDQHNSNNSLYSSNNGPEMKPKQAEDILLGCADSNKTFNCFYCSECHTSDVDRVNHIESKHQGKLYYPTPEDFRNRLN